MTSFAVNSSATWLELDRAKAASGTHLSDDAMLALYVAAAAYYGPTLKDLHEHGTPFNLEQVMGVATDELRSAAEVQFVRALCVEWFMQDFTPAREE